MHAGEFTTGAQRGAARALTPSGSPYTYTAPSNGVIVISVGTVTVIEYGRSGAFYVVGLIAGLFPILNGDSIRVTYAVAPTMTFLPG